MTPQPVEESRVSYLLSRISGGVTEEEFVGVHRELRRTMQDLADHIFNDDFQAPPLFELYWREKCTFYAETPWVEERARLGLALERDITELLMRQVEERRRYGGNCVLEFSGPTGMGKSSSMLWWMERFNRLGEHVRAGGVDALRARLGIDVADLPGKLPHLHAGDAIALDEQLALVGENAVTHLTLLRNAEETCKAGFPSPPWHASNAPRDDDRSLLREPHDTRPHHLARHPHGHQQQPYGAP